MELLLVGVGGVFGSLTRFFLGTYISKHSKYSFPIGTAIINITGAILLGILNGLSINRGLYSLLAEGFLGAYTTFSTFMYEGFDIFENKSKLNAFMYIFITIILGIIAYYIGFKLGKLLK